MTMHAAEHPDGYSQPADARISTAAPQPRMGGQTAIAENNCGFPQWLRLHGPGHSATMAHKHLALAALAVGGAATLAAAPLAQASAVQSHSAAALVSPHVTGVTETSSTTGWAVGFSVPSTGAQPLILRWSGTALTPATSPSPGADGELFGVSADSASDGWAVGHYYKTGNNVAQTLLVHWNGTAWKQFTSPNPGTSSNDLFSVKAFSPNNAWALGTYEDPPATESMLILHWNGKTWAQVPAPNTSSLGTSPSLISITSSSAKDIWAAGTIYNSSNVPRTLLLHFNGSTWTHVTSPDPGTVSDTLDAVSATSPTNAWAVGQYGNTVNGATVSQTLLLHWNGKTWTHVASPKLTGTTIYPNLYSVSADSATDAWAVGNYWAVTSTGRTLQSLTLHYNGTAWTVVASPSNSADYESLRSVSAVSPTSALAVGYGSKSSLLLHWNGKAWTQLPTP